MAFDDLIITPDLVIPAAELDEQAGTSGGPGGQHANKTSTRIMLRWCIATSEALKGWQRALLMKKLAPRLTKAGELIVQVDDNRSQLMNRTLARERLAALIVESLKRPKPRRKTRPTRASKERRITSKKQRGETKKSRKKVRRPRD